MWGCVRVCLTERERHAQIYRTKWDCAFRLQNKPVTCVISELSSIWTETWPRLDGRGEILWSPSTGRMNNLHHIYSIMQSEPHSAFICISAYYTFLSDPDCSVCFPQNYPTTGSWSAVGFYVSLLPVVLTAGKGSDDLRWSKVMINCWWCSSRAWACSVMRKNKQFVARRSRVYKSLFNTLQSCCFPSQQ